MLTDDAPFVLLDDCRAGGGPARLYRDPVEAIVARTQSEVAPALARVREALAQGRHVAGAIGYEAGFALEARLGSLSTDPTLDSPPILWFGVFDAVEMLDRDTVAALLPDPRGAWITPPRPRISRAAYDAAFGRVADYISAGDIYQANLSFRADLALSGHPLALYARLRSSAGAGWGGIVFTGSHWLVSASPELFFALTDGHIAARPMKGTAARGATIATDTAAALALAADPKERAENLMIVDLLRNDIARVATPGSVAVPALFTVETYPTLHTLTSTVTARLDPGRDAIDLLTALFPCGSVTGAPKIRAMEIIAQVEADARGPYTGSIGWLGPDGDAAFNVVIRTLVLDAATGANGARSGSIGLGSAVVADSVVEAEWRECLAKGAFVTHGTTPFELIETLRFEPGSGAVNLDRHLARLARSAAALGFALPPDIPARIDAATAVLDAPTRVRLRLTIDGAVSIDLDALPEALQTPAKVTVVPLPVDRHDLRLRHKTSDRAFYDDARRTSGRFEVLFADRDGFLTEGSFTTLFVERDGILLTPPVTRGLLPGILRERLIDEGRAREADLTTDDLADGILIGNSLRGLIPAILATDTPETSQ